MHHTRYHALRDEGLSQNAISSLFLHLDQLRKGWDARAVTQSLFIDVRLFPLTEADLFPKGKPAHWDRCPECRLFMRFDEHQLCGREGDAPEHQWQVTTPEAVWAR